MLDNLPRDKKELLIEIKCSFGLSYDASKHLDNYFEADELENLQRCLVEFVLNDKYLKEYQPSGKYRKKFLKKIISILENKSYEIDSQIYNLYISTINENQNGSSFDQEKYFICCFFKENMESRPIIIEQFFSAITDGTTGLYTWPACYELIYFFEKNRFMLENKNVLELGSGVGFLGLQCLNWGLLRHFSFSDCHSKVLKQIERNILLNYDEKKMNGLNSKSQEENKLISIFELNWLDFEQSKDRINENIDLIIATDVIFDPDLIEPFVKTLKFIWSCQTNGDNLRAIIASTIRNQLTYQIFLDKLAYHKLRFKIVELKKSTFQSSTPDCWVEIINIFK